MSVAFGCNMPLVRICLEIRSMRDCVGASSQNPPESSELMFDAGSAVLPAGVPRSQMAERVQGSHRAGVPAQAGRRAGV